MSILLYLIVNIQLLFKKYPIVLLMGFFLQFSIFKYLDYGYVSSRSIAVKSTEVAWGIEAVLDEYHILDEKDKEKFVKQWIVLLKNVTGRMYRGDVIPIGIYDIYMQIGDDYPRMRLVHVGNGLFKVTKKRGFTSRGYIAFNNNSKRSKILVIRYPSWDYYVKVLGQSLFLGLIPLFFVYIYIKQDKERSFILLRASAHAKKKAVANIASGIAHKGRNELAKADCILQVLNLESEGLKPGQYKRQRVIDCIENVKQHQDRVLTLFSQLTKFATSTPGKLEEYNIIDAVDEAIKYALLTYPDLSILHLGRTKAKQMEDIVTGNKAETIMMLSTLLNNSHEAKCKTIKVLCEIVGKYYILSITDDGEGMPPHIKRKIFEPYFTYGKESNDSQGSGIGLSSAKAYIEEIGGTIKVESTLSKGTTFIIELLRSHDNV